MSRQRNPIHFLIFGPAIFLLPACGASHHAGLEQARANLVELRQNPEITAHAPVAVREAGQALRQADRVWHDTGDEREVSHLAYLARQRTEIARQMAQRSIAEAEAQRLAQERVRVLMEARERDAEASRKLAEERARDAERARQEAEASARAAREAVEGQEKHARAAEQAQRQAEALAREAETARHEAARRAQELESANIAAEARAREAEEARQKSQAAATRIEELEKQLAAFDARETARGLELTLSAVLFDFDRAALRPGALRDLQPLMRFLRENPDRTVILEGHADSVGSESYNLELSQRRAEAVRDFLMHNGVDTKNVVARGMGEAYPIASNDNEAGRLQNRRVQVIISNAATHTTGQQKN